MPKNDNAHSIRMRESLQENVGDDVAKEFQEKYPLSKSANIQKKFEWADNVCKYLENNFDTDLLVKIRKECRCNDGKSIAGKLSKYLNQSGSVEEFVSKFNANESFAQLEYISEHKILFCYPECYCACIKRVSKNLSMTWCYCTLGNAEGIFTRVFDKSVKVSLLESIKSGGDRCAIEVEFE